VSFLYRGGRTLTVVANHAAKFRQRMRHGRVWTEWLGSGVRQTIFLERYVAGGAAVHNVLLGNPDLLNAALKAALQAGGVWALRNHLTILPLKMAPLAEEIPGGSDGSDDRKQYADGSKTARGRAHQKLPGALEWNLFAHSASPGPYPGPAGPTEEGAYRRQHHRLRQEQSHDPESDRPRTEPPAQAASLLAGSARSE